MTRVRNFQPLDQSSTRTLIEEGLGEHFGCIDTSLNPDLDNIYSHYISAGNYFFVAEQNSKIVGATGLLITGTEAQLVRVSTARQKRRSGIATTLLRHSIEFAQERGMSRLVAHTQPEWSDAVEFYIKNGFTQFGKDEIDVHLQLVLPRA